MKVIQELIERHGGMIRIMGQSLKVRVPGFMDLVVEGVGVGPRGGRLVSVAHYAVVNGDACADPDLVLEILETGVWSPVEITQHAVGVYHRVVWRDEATGKVMIRPELHKDLMSFAKTWNANLKAQGFLDGEVVED